MGIIKCTCNGNEVLYETDTLNVYGDGSHSHPKHEFRIAPHFWYILGGLIFSHFGVVWEMYTLFGSLASNATPIRYNLRIVTDIAIVGPRTLATAGA